MKRLRFLAFPLLLIICFISGCKFDYPNIVTNKTTTTTKEEEKVLNYHIVGLSEYDKENTTFNFVKYSNENYNEILTQNIEVPGYSFVGLFSSDAPDFYYKNGMLEYTNKVTAEYISRYSSVEIYVIFTPISYYVDYSEAFEYEDCDQLDYYSYGQYDRVNGFTPLELKEGWYDFNGEWTITLYSDRSKTFSSIDELLKSKDGYGSIFIEPKATLKDIKKTGTINLDGKFDDIEFEFTTGNANEVDVASFLDSINLIIPEKEGYTSSLNTETFIPIEYTSKNLVIDVTYTPIEYTINFSYEYTGTNGAHIQGNSEIKYTIEDDDIVLAQNNYLDNNSKKVLKVDYWTDVDKNERVDIIDTSLIQNYNLMASVSPIIYTVEEYGHIYNLPYDKEFAYMTEYISVTAKITERTLSIDDFDASNSLNLYSLVTELKNRGNNLITYKTGNDEVTYTNKAEGVTYTFNSKSGHSFKFNYNKIDETSTTIKLYFKNFAFKNTITAKFDVYVDGIIYRSDSYSITKVMKGEIYDYSSYKMFSKKGDSGLWFDVHFNLMEDASGNIIDDDFDLCTYLIDNTTINVLYNMDTYEIEYVVPEGWENSNQTTFRGDYGYYVLSDPTSLDSNGTFHGWSISPNYGEYVTKYCSCYRTGDAANDKSVAGNTITKLYAIIEEPKAEVIMHYGNDMDDVTTYIFNNNDDIVIEDFYKDDYRIRQWYYDPELTQILTDNTIIVENATGEIHLYPKWEFCGYVMTFKSKFDDLDWDYSETIAQYYAQKGLLTEKKNDLVYVFYGTGDNIVLPTLSYPGNNKESIYAWIGNWTDISTDGHPYASGGSINTKLLYRYMNNSPILELDIRVFTKEYDSTLGRKIIKLRTTTISKTTKGGNINEVTRVFATSATQESLYKHIGSAIEFFGITNLYIRVNASFGCSEKVIPELYILIGDGDYTDPSYWSLVSDSNAYSGSYKRLNVALAKNGNAKGAQTLSLEASLTSNQDSYYTVLLSQHNSKYASGGLDVFNPKISVSVEIVIYGY